VTPFPGIERVRTGSQEKYRMLAVVPLFFGHWEIIIVALIALLLFGNRLPSIMRSLGLSITEFKKGVKGIDEDVDVKNDRT
jgi:sec-independent protein translocase protein TatA